MAYTLDEAGQIIRRDETRTSAPSEASPHEIFYRFAGRQMKMTGNDGTADGSYTQSVEQRSAARPDPAKSTAGLFRGGTKTGGGAYADFGLSYDPHNSGYQGSAGGSYGMSSRHPLKGERPHSNRCCHELSRRRWYSHRRTASGRYCPNIS